LANLTFWSLMIVVMIAKAAALFPIVFALFGQGTGALLGPLFIPFLAVPQFDWIFKNWFRGFLYFSMVQPFAFASLFIFQRFVFNFSAGLPVGITVAQYPLYFTEAVVVIMTCCVMPLSVPWVASAYMSGHSGGSGSSSMLLSMVTRKRAR